ncbi:MAG TPA: NAD-dependent epimerase/dehydratase family protein, partial [Polyangiaceae bacterium]|nr:NAD-dependent epimerase/dehydratase family protein [Polyangiaceae bacterium]
LTLFGDGNQSRSFCYVDDLIDGFVRVARLPSLDGPLNLGNPDELSMLELAREILALTGSRSPLVFSALPADDPKQRRPDIARARSLIAFEPRTRLREGLAQTIEDFAPRVPSA